MSERAKVGFAGIGRMGLPMAASIARAGFPLLVWNRSREKAEALAGEGARVVDAPHRLAEADVVVTMLADAAAAHAVIVDSGLLKEMRAGSIVLEMSTIGPRAARELAEEAAAHEVALLDAPVSGSVTVAEAGELFSMVGGDPDAYERASPVLDAMTRAHILLGPSGTGAAMKLALNSMIAVTNESIAETLVLSERFGIDRERAYDVLAASVLSSAFVLYKRGAFLHPESEPVAFTTALMHKDVSLAREHASDLDVRLPALTATVGVLDEAVRGGLAEADMASILGLISQPQHQTEEP